jgi:hypothetical protein
MTHWVKKLGIASAFALALGFSLPGEASASPAFCRSGAGHPVHGRSWCIDKGFGLGRSYVRHDDDWRYPRTRYRYDNDRYRYGNDRYRTYDRWRPSWSYTPGYDWRYNNSVRTRRYGAPAYQSGWSDRYRYGSSHGGHRHDRDCRH